VPVAPVASPDKAAEPKTVAGQPEAANVAANSLPDDSAKTLQRMMAEIQQLGGVDPAAQSQLLEDLRQTDPALWPLVMQQFRAAVAFRRQANHRGVADGDAGSNVAASESPAGDRLGLPDRDAALDRTLPQPETHAAGPVPALQQSSADYARMGRLPAPSDAILTPSAPPPNEYPHTAHAAGRTSNEGKAVSEVTAASYTESAAEDWHGHLRRAIEAARSELPQRPDTAEEVASYARLRMLSLLAGQREEAVRPIPGADPAMQEYWSQQLFALGTLLDPTQIPDPLARSAETKRMLNVAADRLAESAPLVVRNLLFCSKVHSYGCVEQFERYEFVPEQELLLYAELENFTSRQTESGYHTALRSSYQIFDGSGRRVVHCDLGGTEEYCRNPRHDYFVGYHLYLPERIYRGKHTLKLTVEDLKSKKVGESTIEFTVVEKPR